MTLAMRHFKSLEEKGQELKRDGLVLKTQLDVYKKWMRIMSRRAS